MATSVLILCMMLTPHGVIRIDAPISDSVSRFLFLILITESVEGPDIFKFSHACQGACAELACV